jgi:PelA/Pel-15E family pectate lyase
VVSWGTLALISGLLGASGAQIAVPPAPVPAPAPAAEAIDGDPTQLLAASRIAALAPPLRRAWSRYLETSDRLRARDRAAMDAELRAAGRTTMTPGPYLKAFRVGPEMTEAWFRSDAARTKADNMLTFQTPSGGWSKRVDVLSRPRAPGQSYFGERASWSYVATIDNDSTTEEIRFLAVAYASHHDPRYREAALRGIDYLIQAQFPNGCWPQNYPLQGGYHDAVTFNDNAIVNVLRLLSDVATGQVSFPPPPRVRRRAAASVAQGLECILASQVSVGSKKTVWAQQHDPLTLAPVPARSYELRGLCGRESAWIVSYLMSVPAPDARVVAAVDAAIAWFRTHEIFGYDYDQYVLTKSDGAGPLWARITEIETDRAIFSNRDGVKLYDWERLTDRRQGYTWFSKEPAASLEEYARWKAARTQLDHTQPDHAVRAGNSGAPATGKESGRQSARRLPEKH